MGFVTPLMLLGLLGIGIPIAIHLIGRRRARRVKFAAVDFLLGSDEKLARKLRLRDFMLLLMRVLICLAIPLILAKPYRHCTATGPAVERGAQAAVVVFDDSLVTGHVGPGGTLLDRQKELAASIVDRLGPEAEVALLSSTSATSELAELSRDHQRLRATIESTEARPLAPDFAAALERARRLLATSDQSLRRVYLISPMPATGFGDVAAVLSAADAPSVKFVDSAEGVALTNLAVVDVQVDRNPDSGSTGIRVRATIVNFGAEPVRDATVQLEIDEHVAAQGTISLGAFERGEKSFAALLPSAQSPAEIVVSIEDDALRADNRRYAIAQLRDQVPTLIVNGDPRTTRHDDELFYLEAALRPGDRSDSGVLLKTVTEEEITEDALKTTEVVILANVRAQKPEVVALLARWVADGGGLLVAVGDNVDADDYNRTMRPLLPQSLQTVKDTGFGRTGDEKDGSALRLAKLDNRHPILSVFPADAPSLRDAKYSRIMLLGPTTEVRKRRVLAHYDNGAAALVEGESGKGRLLLYTSTIDRDWNELPIHPGYLPLTQSAVRYLARKQDRLGARALLIGRTAQIAVRAEDERLEVRVPNGDREVFEREQIGERKSVRFNRTATPGIYRVTAFVQAEAKPRPEASFAVNISESASDVRRTDPNKLIGDGQRGKTAVADTTHTRRVELWHAIALSLLLFLLLESLLMLRRRRR